MDPAKPGPSIVLPIVVTGAALALVNTGLATLIASAVGARIFAPTWSGVVLLVLGVLAVVAAVALWRQYVAARRQN